MKKLFYTFSLFILTVIPCFAGIPTATSLAPILEKVLPSVVNIRAQLKITDIATLN